MEEINIVLIEDNENHANFIASILNSEPYKIKFISNGKEAIKYLKSPEVKPDAILIDNYLSDIEGVEIISHFTNSKYNYPFIILTGQGSANLAVKALRLGALDYVTKSLNLSEELEIVIERAIKRHQAEEEKIALENELRKSEEKYRSLIENINEIIFRLDNNSNIVYISQNAEKILGYKLSDVRKIKITDIIHPKDHKKLFSNLKKAFSGNPNKFSEYRIIGNKGKMVWVKTSVTPIYFNEEIIGIQGVLNDISELKNTELALKQSEKQLLKLNADKDRFVKILAHDLRNPIANIISFSQLLENTLKKEAIDKAIKISETINNVSESTFSLLEDLLSWFNAQSGKMTFEPQKLLLHDVFNEIIYEFNEIAKKKSITIYNKTEKDIELYADKTMIKTVFRNLISNAIKFTNENGEVELNGKNAINSTKIQISDTGLGMSKEVIEKLWDFTKPHSTKGTDNEKGSGLGLLICKEFIDKHNGKIKIKSQVGVGTVFKIEIPKQSI
jgi:two-component system, sensor histidine kinase and response regulator